LRLISNSRGRMTMHPLNGDPYDQALWFFEVWSHYGAAGGGSLRNLYYQLRRHRHVISYAPLVEAATRARALGVVDTEASAAKAEEDPDGA
jgi:hypothetical protein